MAGSIGNWQEGDDGNYFFDVQPTVVDNNLYYYGSDSFPMYGSGSEYALWHLKAGTFYVDPNSHEPTLLETGLYRVINDTDAESATCESYG
jgi:hypothetical protein